MAENGTTDIKVQLEGLKKEIENINSINSRIDTAIEKLTDLSTSIKSMLAVHEEKLDQQEKVDEVIFNKISIFSSNTALSSLLTSSIFNIIWKLPVP